MTIDVSDPLALGFDPGRLTRIDEMMMRYVDSGRSAGMQTLVVRRGQPVHFSKYGCMNIESQSALRDDTIFRIFSMTKPITSAALMTLFEQGKCHLDDDAARWIPALRSLQVQNTKGEIHPLESNITIRQLLTHTAGFSYGFDPDNCAVDKLYASVWESDYMSKPLGELLDLMLTFPLVAQPGTRWHYSIATDICGYLVERMSDMPFGDYLRKTFFEPLGMIDTDFHVPTEKSDRFATLY
ncbi:MAG: serine hydrolase domain-containing protein, partial [Pseudomonadota bacterium]